MKQLRFVDLVVAILTKNHVDQVFQRESLRVCVIFQLLEKFDFDDERRSRVFRRETFLNGIVSNDSLVEWSSDLLLDADVLFRRFRLSEET